MIDAGRLRRAIHLEVLVVGAGAWEVLGGRQGHRVEKRGGRLCCDCQDAMARPGVHCKHVIAIHLSRLPQEVRDGLRELVPAEGKVRR